MEETMVLCGASAYEKKFYLNPEFSALPDSVQKELNIMCVLFTEEVGGILTLEYDTEGHLELKVQSKDYDPLFDEIGSGLKIKQLINEKQDLFEALETFYRVFVLGLED
ncbi:MAG: hypothetical protein HFI34_05570 [Lachnospiraceae bacterium]|nr:hypothetical protein [Lachnospiraceae bacterium]